MTTEKRLPGRPKTDDPWVTLGVAFRTSDAEAVKAAAAANGETHSTWIREGAMARAKGTD